MGRWLYLILNNVSVPLQRCSTAYRTVFERPIPRVIWTDGLLWCVFPWWSISFSWCFSPLSVLTLLGFHLTEEQDTAIIWITQNSQCYWCRKCSRTHNHIPIPLSPKQVDPPLNKHSIAPPDRPQYLGLLIYPNTNSLCWFITNPNTYTQPVCFSNSKMGEILCSYVVPFSSVSAIVFPCVWRSSATCSEDLVIALLDQTQHCFSSIFLNLFDSVHVSEAFVYGNIKPSHQVSLPYQCDSLQSQ